MRCSDRLEHLGIVILMALAASVGQAEERILQGPDGPVAYHEPPRPAPVATLAKGGTGTISGQVLTALGNVDFFSRVVAYEDGNGAFFVADARVDQDGNYTLTLPPGDYTVVTDLGPFPDDNAIDQVYPASLCLGGPFSPTCDPLAGDLIQVDPGQNVTGIDFSLPLGGRVTGFARERTTGFNTDFAEVRYYDLGGSLVATSFAGIRRNSSEVTYGPHAVPAGDYFVQVGVDGYTPILFPDIDCPDFLCDPTNGTPITLTAGADSRADVSMRLEPGVGAVSGIVFGAETFDPDVDILNASGGRIGEASSFIPLNAPFGGYIVSDLPAGNFFARLFGDGMRMELYSGIPCPDSACLPAGTGANAFPVQLDQVTGGIDFRTGLARDRRLTAAPVDPDPGDRLGAATAADGNLVVVGQPNAPGGGQVVVFRVEAQALVQETVIQVPVGRTAAEFGASLALEGDRLVVGAPGSAAIRAKGNDNALQAAIFERLGQNWTMKEEFGSAPGAGDDRFGASVALSGGRVVIGAPMDSGQGLVYAYGLDGFNVVDQATIPPPDPVAGGQFGASVAAKGTLVGVGAPGSQLAGVLSGTATLYGQVAGNLASLTPRGTVNGSGSGENGGFGTSIALSGDTMVIGAPGENSGVPGSGATYAFGFTATTVSERMRLQPTTPQAGGAFGTAVDIGIQGVVVGSPGANGGRGQVFEYGPGFALAGVLSPPSAGLREFGASVSAGGQVIAVGAPGSDASSGAALAEIDFDLTFASGFE